MSYRPPPAFGPDEAPAPVVTPERTYGTLPPAYDDPFELETDEGGPLRTGLRWLGAAGVLVGSVLWLLALSAAQATSPEVARPALERGLTVLTEAPALLALHAEEIEAAGQGASGEGAVVPVPGYPVQGVGLTAEEATSGLLDEQRDALIERSVDRVREDGAQALHDPQGAPLDTADFSTPGGVRRVLDLLAASNHDRVAPLVLPLGLGTLAAGALFFVTGHGFWRFGGIGLAMLAAALIVAGGTLVVRLALIVVGNDGSAVSREFAEIAQTLAWAPMRNVLWFGAAALALLLPSLLLGGLFGASERRRREREREERVERYADEWGA